MKRLKKLIASLIIMLTVAMVCNTVQAEEVEGNLFYNDAVQNLQIGITYENNDVSINIISPSGRVITRDEISDDIAVFSTDSGTYFIIKKAEAGQWRIRYDKGSNSSISASVDKYEDPIWITDFKIVSIQDEELTYEFMAEQTEDVFYEYTLSLALDKNGGDVKELDNGYAYANELVSGTIDLSEVNTYKEYYLQLYVSYYRNDLEYFDLAYSDSFSYNNPNQVEGIDDFSVTINESENTVYVNWDDHIPYDTDQIYVVAKADGEEIYSELINPWENDDCYISYEEGINNLVVGISLQRNGLATEFLEKTCNIVKKDTDFQLILPEDGLTNSYQWTFGYKNALNQNINLNVNGIEQSLVLNGSGDKILTLNADTNSITITYLDEAGITHTITKYANIDNIPPSLKILEKLDGSKTVKDSVIITGKTDPGSVLTINASAVEIDTNGLFSYKLPLVVGSNEITITSADELGNTAMYKATVIRNEDGVAAFNPVNDTEKTGLSSFIKKYLPFVIAGGVLILAVIIVLVLLIVRKKKAKDKKQVDKLKLWYGGALAFTVITGLLSVSGFVYYFIRKSYQKSENYIRLAYQSVEDAYQYLSMTDRIFDLAKILLILAGVSLLITLILSMVLKKRAKKSESANASKPDQKQDKQEKTVIEDNKIEAVNEQMEEKTEATAEEKTEATAEEKTEVIAEEKKDDKAEEKIEYTAEEKIEYTAEEKTNDNAKEMEVQKAEANYTESKYCSACGAKLSKGDKFCKTCGSKQD